MMADELLERLSEYNDWHKPVPNGWLPMDDLDLMARPVEFLLADGARTRRPGVSNADWIVSGLRPVAWRPVDPAPSGVDLTILYAGIR